jgi:ABC-type dipeptide/oligopeptide/nickel transport system ATPase component
MMDNRQNILEIDNLQTFFFTRQGTAKAVNGVGFRLRKGEILGVVGESGCGKSMTAFSVLRLVPYPGRIVRGSILFNGQDLLDLHPSKMRRIRGDRISMIFQEPMISLNPAFTVGRQLIEALRVHRKISTA